MRTLVLGLGNEILSDDGVGLLASRRVHELSGGETDLAEMCVATIDLLWLMSGYEKVVIVDSLISAELPVGTPVRATPEELPTGFGYRSFHTLTFREVLEMGRWLGVPLPGEVMIHGLVVDETATFGEQFSPEVAKAWEAWAQEIAETEFGAAATEPDDRPLVRSPDK
jgi:hydrogenase maturation protease